MKCIYKRISRGRFCEKGIAKHDTLFLKSGCVNKLWLKTIKELPPCFGAVTVRLAAEGKGDCKLETMIRGRMVLEWFMKQVLLRGLIGNR